LRTLTAPPTGSMEVQCPSCAARFPVDPSRVPTGGVLAICARCLRAFEVAAGAAAGSGAAPDHAFGVAARGVEAGAPELEVHVDLQAPEVDDEFPAPEAEADATVLEEADTDAEAEAGPIELGEEPEPDPEREPLAPEEAPAPPTTSWVRVSPPTEPWRAPGETAAPVEEKEAAEEVQEEGVEEVEALEEREIEAHGAHEPGSLDTADLPGTLVEEVAPPEAEAPAEPLKPTDPAEGISRFARRDPANRARRLARVLASDMITYNPARYAEALKNGTLREDFLDEIEKSWEEYMEQVGEDFARSTDHFAEALNEVLAQGKELFRGPGRPF
jgi:predicted Zn finger-like uncharacterized protein